MQSVFIRKCENCVVTIQGKMKQVTVEGCRNFAFIFDDVIADVEIINGQKIQLQANGTVSSIVVEKTEGASLYLQKEGSQKAQIITSNSSEVNVIVPSPNPNDPPKEFAVPFQFVSQLQGEKLVTKPVEHSGN
jgi:adenylyl cyclase-associated protein